MKKKRKVRLLDTDQKSELVAVVASKSKQGKGKRLKVEKLNNS
jgi:hypothetical protein